MRAILPALALLLAACGSPTSGSEPLELSGRVVDQANMFDAAAELALTKRLEAIEHHTSDQVVIVTVDSLHGQSIEKVAFDLGNRWGVGREDVDNGVILLVAPKDRKVRIEVGLGLEGLLTDQKAAAIIKTMIPELQQGRMKQGINIGIDGLEMVLKSDLRRPQLKTAPMKEAA